MEKYDNRSETKQTPEWINDCGLEWLYSIVIRMIYGDIKDSE